MGLPVVPPIAMPIASFRMIANLSCGPSSEGSSTYKVPPAARVIAFAARRIFSSRWSMSFSWDSAAPISLSCSRRRNRSSTVSKSNPPVWPAAGQTGGLLLETVEDLFRRLEQLNEIGAALSQEKDIDHLLEKILLAAKAITRAAGGTLYVLEPSDEGPQLRFAIMRNEAMGIAMGGTTGNPIPFYPVHLYGKDGTPNNQMVAAYTALT